jgi:dolichol-phosphate mannosyltransferase
MTTATPATDTVDLTIMIPAYLEADNLRFLLPQIKEACAALTPSYEVLIVDAPERVDDTPEVCAANGVRHIFGAPRYGGAVRSGIAAARGRYILSMDADGSHSPIYYAAMWQLRNDFDIIIGSRYVAGGHTENPFILIFLSYVLNLTFRIAFSIKAKDVTTSFRLYRRSVFDDITLESNDFDILEELLIKVLNKPVPAKIAEVPILFEKRKEGDSKRNLVQFAYSYFKTLRKLRKFQADARRKLAASK